MFSAWWETADMALCLWPRAEAPVQLAELHFSQAVPSCVCLLHLKLIFWVVWQAFPRCPSLQHMWFRWVPWAVPASRPDFWFLTLVRLPWVYAVGFRQKGLAVGTYVIFLGFGLFAAPAMFFGGRLTQSDSHPYLWSIVFFHSDSLAVLCYLAGASDSVGQGNLSVCPQMSWSFPRTCEPVPVCLRSGSLQLQCPSQVPEQQKPPQQALPWAYCLHFTEAILKKEGSITWIV